MTFQQFMHLKAGDVVLWNNRTLRTVLRGPVDFRFGSVEFAIRRRSWRNRVTTSYGWNDVKHLIKRTNHVTKRVCLPEERDRIERIGFSPVVELRREWRAELACSLRMGRNCGLKIRRLPTL